MASVVVSLLHSLRFLVRSRASLHLEILALRHQLTVVNRSRGTPPHDIGRPDAVGVALASLARLEIGGSHRQTGTCLIALDYLLLENGAKREHWSVPQSVQKGFNAVSMLG